MKKLIPISSFVICIILIGLATNRMYGQILITNGQDTKPSDSVHTLLELHNDTSNANLNKPSKSLLLPISDSMRKRKLGQTPNFPQGALIYDSSNRLIYVFSQGQWRALDTTQSKTTAQPGPLDINKDDLENDPFGNGSSSGNTATQNNKNSLVIKTPKGYAPFEVKNTGTGGGSTNSTYPLVHITYNGISLTQDKDFKASFEGGNDNSEKKIKVEFLTLAPEEWKGFSSFSAEYVPLR